MKPLVLFGGLVRVQMYGYYWVHSSAQIDLIAIDAPLVAYNHKKDGEVNHTKKDMDNIMAKWTEKRKKQGKDSDFSVGTKLNLNEFLRTGIDALNNTKTE